jgi:uncharacterized membrane protein YqiK
MTDEQRAPAWFAILVVLAVIVGVALAFWFYGVITAPAG